MTPEFGYVEFQSIEAAERALNCESHVILNHKVTVENHRNGLANSLYLSQPAKKPNASSAKEAKVSREAKVSNPEDSTRGPSESPGDIFGFVEEDIAEYPADFDEGAYGEALEEQEEDFSEENESEESQSVEEEEDAEEGETEHRFGTEQKEYKSPAEYNLTSGCAQNSLLNSFGERHPKHQLQTSQIVDQPSAANPKVYFGQFGLLSGRLQPDMKNSIVGWTQDCPKEKPVALQEPSHLKRLISRHSRKIRSVENDTNYNFKTETRLAFQARLLRTVFRNQNRDMNPQVRKHGLISGANFS